MPLFSDTEGPAPDWAARASVTDMLTIWADAVRRGRVVYLTGPGDDDVMVVAPVDVVEAGLAALGRTGTGELGESGS
ncbi:hypothetical protein [Actinokineospora cianjurensis]|uniref:hypothetical protein n=1 Tax=Actinokineospora cianjurensis TaxID=585224 RepID=UPI0011C3DE7E|nr:hypothetical protein [Actinokineospora cianjurensis]